MIELHRVKTEGVRQQLISAMKLTHSVNISTARNLFFFMRISSINTFFIVIMMRAALASIETSIIS